jgi:predicted TIM-barrel fold metal-dependent hydrolase
MDSEVARRRAAVAQQGERTFLIDTDVHEYMHSALDLVPFLPSHWQRYLTDGRWDKSKIAQQAYGIPNEFHGTRSDWLLSDGTMGTNLEQMRNVLFGAEHVDMAILNGFAHFDAMRGNYELATALASAYNDWQVQEWLDKEARLRGSVHVVTRDPQQAAKEIDRVAEHPSIVQVFLPAVSDCEYGDPFYRPIFEAAVRNNLAVALHHGLETRSGVGYPRYYVEWHTLAPPQASISQLVSLIANGLFDRLPELKVVLLETGVAWVPWLMWRFDQQYRENRAEIPWVKRLPSDHMRDSVRLSTQPMGDIKTKQFLQLVEMAKAERMFMFSTDFPHCDADALQNVLPAAVPIDLRRRIMYQNAIETYPRLQGFLN